MSHNAGMLDLIERTFDDHPICSACGAQNDIREHDGQLWLECSSVSVDPPTGLIARLGAALMPHPRRLILDLREDRAA